MPEAQVPESPFVVCSAMLNAGGQSDGQRADERAKLLYPRPEPDASALDAETCVMLDGANDRSVAPVPSQVAPEATILAREQHLDSAG